MSKKVKKDAKEKEKEIEIQIEEEVMDDENLLKEKKEISDLMFIEKRSNTLKFKVYFKDGSIAFLTNKQIRKLNPDILLDFYEQNILVSF